jgi:deoxyribodipyrimidine photo-lyase
MVSAREAARTALDASSARGADGAEGPSAWLRQLVWRDFYLSILAHFPHVARRSFRPAYDRVKWRNDEADFAAWREGHTGYPIVDAAMRQLVQTGWIHNRARMIVASFLVKDLLIDWRWGERFFMEHLIDGDPAANNGGWQWVAGTGTDAAPYFRVFNPTVQARRYDPDGVFVRAWLPELSAVPDDFVHTPWRMPDTLQRASRCVIDADYPSPIVDHRWAREQALAAFAAARRASEPA